MKTFLLFLFFFYSFSAVAQKPTQQEAEQFILKKLRTYVTLGDNIGTIDFQFADKLLISEMKNVDGGRIKYSIRVEFFKGLEIQNGQSEAYKVLGIFTEGNNTIVEMSDRLRNHPPGSLSGALFFFKPEFEPNLAERLTKAMKDLKEYYSQAVSDKY